VATPCNAPIAALVELQAITKSFPGVIANKHIDLEIYPGQVHVLLGENGAGKSTLVGILSGLYQPDSGKILINGNTVKITSPRKAIELGIGTVQQHSTLVPTLTTIENLMLGQAWHQGKNANGIKTKLKALCAKLGISIDPDIPTGKLALGQQQQVEILKALWRGERVLVLDEPTSMLTTTGIDNLGAVIRRLAQDGITIIFITHKLQEAYDFGDNITMLRRGKVVGSITSDTLKNLSFEKARDDIVELLFNKYRSDSINVNKLDSAFVSNKLISMKGLASQTLMVTNLSTIAEKSLPSLSRITFSVEPGKIFGIAGVDGNGQKQLAETLSGQRRSSAGRVMLGEKDITNLNVSERLAIGLTYITDDRYEEATVSSLNISANALIKRIGEKPFWRWHVNQHIEITDFTNSLIKLFDVRSTGSNQLLGTLSGGNIQKVVLGRELVTEPKVIIYNKPTYGLDLSNTQEIRRLIRKQAYEGVATVVISTELDELLELCDHIGVMSRGSLAGIIKNGEGAEVQIGKLILDTDLE